jgi:hypothetical protein
MTETGGIAYVIPLAELPALCTLLQRGRAWAASNGIELAPDLAARLRDIERTVDALKPVAPATPPSASPLHSVKIDPMGTAPREDETGVAGAANLLGVSRQRVNRRLLNGSLPGRRDEAGHWRIPITALAKGA